MPGEKGFKAGESYWWTPACLGEVSLYSSEARLALCYPITRLDCTSRVYVLERLGITKLCSLGPTRLPGFQLRVLGKGHASVVVAGVGVDGSIVAIKARRVDGKRLSLRGEGLLLEEASRAGVAPQPLFYDDDIIVMNAILGPRMEDLVKDSNIRPRFLLEALRAARTLDIVGILHLELSRPLRNILYTGYHESSKAIIVDYESARRGCGNILSLLGGLTRLKALESIVNSSRVRELAKLYKRECSKDVYKLIEEIVVKTLKHYGET